jgi:serine protease
MARTTPRLHKFTLRGLLLCLAMSAAMMISCLRPDNINRQEANLNPAPQTEEDSIETELYHDQRVCKDQILVKFALPPNKININKLTQLAKQYAGEHATVEAVGGAGFVLVRSPQRSIKTLIENFEQAEADKKVEYYEPDFVVKADALPNDALFGNLWGLNVMPGQTLGDCGAGARTPLTDAIKTDVDVNAPEAWNNVDPGDGPNRVVVAVLDTGVNYNHEDLIGNIWEAYRTFKVTIDNKDIECGAGTHGFNAITTDMSKRCDPMPKKNSSHGTQVAGVISARKGNERGVAGVSQTLIMGIKVFNDTSDEGCLSHVLNGIAFVIEIKTRHPDIAAVRVLNNSYGLDLLIGTQVVSLTQEIKRALDAGLLFVASAGNGRGSNNDELPHYPSNIKQDNIIAVTGTNHLGAIDSDFNYGRTSVHIAAPGIAICTTNNSEVQPYGYQRGTSFAAPFVSGAAALMFTKCRNLKPLTVKNILLDTTAEIKPMPKPIARGRLNIHRAVKATSPCQP